MKKLALFTITFFISTLAFFAQSNTCDCKTDLDFIVEKIKKMPSYKKQINGNKEVEFETTYHTLSSKMKEPILVEDCYKMLLKQMLLVNDAHASLQINTTIIPETILENDSQFLEF